MVYYTTQIAFSRGYRARGYSSVVEHSTADREVSGSIPDVPFFDLCSDATCFRSPTTSNGNVIWEGDSVLSCFHSFFKVNYLAYKFSRQKKCPFAVTRLETFAQQKGLVETRNLFSQVCSSNLDRSIREKHKIGPFKVDRGTYGTNHVFFNSQIIAMSDTSIHNVYSIIIFCILF